MKHGREWMGISDLMSGLMMVFMFIAILFMITTEREKNAMREIALTYEQGKTALRNALAEEFDKDLNAWGAEILPDSTIRFKEPDVLFARNSVEINGKFKSILDDFFPRYLGVLTSSQFSQDIEEVRIEGHTSSVWRKDSTSEFSYLQNAALSQARSMSVLRYVYTLEPVRANHEWLSTVLRANGISYAKRIFQPDGSEDLARSRRVEFRVLTKAEERIYTILDRIDD